jgi:nicotinamide mononucleotide transporter
MIEIISAIITLISVILLSNKKNIGWIIGIIGGILYAIIFFNTKLYANFGLQFIFIIQSIYGIYIWNKYKKNNKIIKETKVSKLTKNEYIISFFSIIITWIITFSLLNNYTNSIYQYTDSLILSISIIANWLLSIRKLESWLLWIIVNIISIILFYQTELYITLGLYIIFLINAIYGYFNWKKDI